MKPSAVICLLAFTSVLPTAHASQQVRTSRAGDELKQSSWFADVSRDLERGEYHFSPVQGEQDVWSAPCRAQNVRSRVSARGIEVVSRTADAVDPAVAHTADGGIDDDSQWKLLLATKRFGRVDHASELDLATAQATRERVELNHGLLAEWFANDERGIEHGWTIASAPGGAEPLWIEIEIGGDLYFRIDAGGRSGMFVDASGAVRLRYRDLVVIDATGRELDVRLTPNASGVGIEIDDTGAVYPLIVESVLTGLAWTAEGDQEGALFAVSLASAGDVNGDGYSDVIVGASAYDNGQFNEGRAFVYLGSGEGLATSADWTAESDQIDASFGHSVATAGDVNGDGYSDVIISANRYDNGEVDEGRAFVYLGSRGGLLTTAAWTAESDQADSWFGHAVATAGDVNGDGYSDVIVGALLYDNGQLDEGRVFVYLGSDAGLSTSAAWAGESDQANSSFGFTVAPAGDVNGDGFSDVLVGADSFENGETIEGRAYLYLGSAVGLSSSAAWTAEGGQDSAHFGTSVATAGDVNGDGYSDVLIGAVLYDNDQANEGRAFLYLGSNSGLSTNYAWTAESDQTLAYFAFSVATAGDVNGDGYSDVIVGSHWYDNDQANEGRVFVYLGSSSGLSTSAAWTAESGQAGALFGSCVGTAGDVNGDGFSDIIVGAYRYDNGQPDEGRAFVYLGSSSGLSTGAAWTAESNQTFAYFGFSVATAGDVNGDGYSDVIVGSHQYDNGQTNEGRAFVYLGSSAGLSTSAAWTAESDQADSYFGVSVATAGDVNGDGFSDVIVGSYQYDNGQTNEGRAFVYLGSSAGLSTSAAWTTESNQADAFLGFSVATAGDVNGDGYSDVIVASLFYDNDQTNEGRALVYLGSHSGLATSAAWTAESDQTDAFFGFSVATAGDVNGDGFSDVIVGAPYYDNDLVNEGRAFLYLGSSSPLKKRL